LENFVLTIEHLSVVLDFNILGNENKYGFKTIKLFLRALRKFN
jgi:hypothetical protein